MPDLHFVESFVDFMSPLFVILGFVDLFAAALIFFPFILTFSETLLLYLMVYMIAKGGFFLLSGIASKSMSPLCMGFCVIDILTGIVLGAMSLGFSHSILKTVGIVSMLKGFYCFVTPIFS